MERPHLRYIEAGGVAPMPSVGAVTAPGRALGQFGQVLEGLGERGFQIAEQIQNTEDAGKISAWRANADERASRFSDSLLSRQDPDQWGEDWTKLRNDLGAEIGNLGLSPRAEARARMQFDEWASGRTADFSTKAAVRKVNEGKARIGGSWRYQAERGDREGMDATRAEAAASGVFAPSELEEMEREADRISNLESAKREMKDQPLQFLEDLDGDGFLDSRSGLTTIDQERLKAGTEEIIADRRNAEIDALNTAFKDQTLRPSDIEAATYLSDRDRQSFHRHLEKNTAPTREQLAEQWDRLDTLREARGDGGITPEQYRTLYYETKSAVLASVSPAYQGELSKELGYLSPAGRQAAMDRGMTGPVTKEDLFSIGRGIITRARQADIFGDVTNGNAQEKEKAFRREEDLSLELKRFMATNPKATEVEVRDAVDRMISGSRAATNATDLQQFMPGAGRSMLPPSRSAGRQKSADQDAQLNEGSPGMSGALLPPLELDEFLSR